MTDLLARESSRLQRCTDATGSGNRPTYPLLGALLP
jgi:hypothetical protein